MIKIIVTLFWLILNCNSSSSTIINCKYQEGTFIAVGRIYQCIVDSDPNILTPQSAKIESFNGVHQRNKEDKNVYGLYAVRRTIQYFPNGLQKFTNIKSIQVISCKLQEIHQSDLKPFADLILIYLENNSIEVLEEGLFAYNKKLEVIGFAQNKIVHIDPNVFDQLTKLSDFLFNGVPCIDSLIYSSVEKVKNVIKLAKTKCVSVDFKALEDKVKKLDDERTSLSSEDFNRKLADLEIELKNSNFSNFRPLSYKFEKLKNLKVIANGTFTESQQSKISSDPVTQKIMESCSETETFPGLEVTLQGFTNQMTSLIANVSNQFTVLNSSFSNYEMNQRTFQNINKNFQESMTNSIDVVSGYLQKSHDNIKILKDEIKETVSDTIASTSDVKTNQIEIQASLSKLKTQNEMKISLNDLKTLVLKNENCDGKFSLFNDKLESLEGQFENFETKTVERFDQIERGFANVGHKILINFDEKVKGIEKRLMKKFEELLQENLGKILEDKLEDIMNDRSVTKS